MDIIKDFFSAGNLSNLFERFYNWLQSLLSNWFGNISYDPIRDLLTNPWFWLIILGILLLGLIFRRR